jgi:hypothetical protein
MQFSSLASNDKVQIYLLFYKPTASDPFQNRLVAFFNGPYCHVEMAFPERGILDETQWEKGEVWGTSVYQGETIFFKPKTYQRDGYFSFAIEVTQAQRIRIKEYCRMQAEREVTFSRLAMYMAYLPWQVMDVEGTFCSKHVASALQVGQVEGLDQVNPSLVTPSSLFRMLLRKSQQMDSPIVHVVPSRMSEDSMQSSAQSLLREMITLKRQT